MNKKNMMKVCELIPHLKEKNIKFDITSEVDAENYLRTNNNYYNLVSFRQNFERATSGYNTGKYLDLDFAYLQDLSIIDYRLRVLLFDMTINIEHYLKIKILNDIENVDEEDGYRIVNLYLKNDYLTKKKVHNSIFNKIGSDHYKEIVDKYDLDKDKLLEDIPIWVFLEIITFGELVNFYNFYSKEYNDKFAKHSIYILRDIIRLRNAVAHNNYILNNLSISDNSYPPSTAVTSFLSECGIEREMRKRKLSNSRIRQITYTLYYFNVIVTSDGIRKNVCEKLNKLMFNRIKVNSSYYNNNGLLISVYVYFSKIINKHYTNL